MNHRPGQPSPTGIFIRADGPQYQQQCEQLARQLRLPVVSGEVPGQQPFLQLGACGIEFCMPGMRPVRVDFGGDLSRRGRLPGAELLVKAMGRGARAGVRVLDATAGLGRDAFLLASAGFEVTMLERQPVLHAMLDDGLARGMQNPSLADTCSRMQLHAANALDCLPDCSAEIVYLDPMFLERDGSAAVGRESQMLRLLASPDATEEPAILRLAREAASKRVVVKRHRNAPVLADAEPSYQLPGKSTRFDIYLSS